MDAHLVNTSNLPLKYNWINTEMLLQKTNKQKSQYFDLRKLLVKMHSIFFF